MSPTRERFAAVVREDPVDVVTALTLLAAEAGEPADVAAVLAELDSLAAAAVVHLQAGATPAAALQAALGVTLGFSGSEPDYGTVAASLLPAVLRRRSGLPILLAVVWVQVARRLGMPARCLATPGHVLAEIAGVVVDPFGGGVPADQTMSLAETLDGGPLLLRVLANLRALASRTGDTVLALWAVELSLLLPSHPLDLRRERGMLLVRAGDFPGGARELEAFAGVAPPPQDEEARRAAVMARARLN